MMKISVINTCIRPPAEKSKAHFQMHIGALLEICGQDALRKNIDIKSFLHWIKPAILHDQFLLLQNAGEVSSSAYITWAFVNKETLHRYSYGPRFILHPSEWNEGTHLIVVDFCSLTDPRRLFKKLLNKAKALHELGIESITVCTRDKSGLPIHLHQIYLKAHHA